MSITARGLSDSCVSSCCTNSGICGLFHLLASVGVAVKAGGDPWGHGAPHSQSCSGDTNFERRSLPKGSSGQTQRTKRSPAVKKRISLSLTQSFPNTSSHNPLLAEGQHRPAKHSEKHTALPRAAQRSLIVSSASSELKITWKPHVNHLRSFITATS